MDYLLSVVVPTKNRYIYLRQLIKLIAKHNLQQLEFVIQDNSDDNSEIIDFLSDYSNCDNIKYYYSRGDYAATENADKAILNSQGEYVCFIGDDDGVSRNICDIVAYMKKNNIDSLITNKPSFLWPDIKGQFFNFAGSVRFKNSSNSIRYINIHNELHKCLRVGATTMLELPRVYHGIIHRETLNQIYNKVGTFFPGPCPDISNAIALCFFAKKHAFVDYPFIISGTGFNSAGGLGARHEHSAAISSVSFLPKDTEAKWSSNIPKFWLPQTIWPNSAIAALKQIQKEEYIKLVNLHYVYAAILTFNFTKYKLLNGYISISNIFPVLYYAALLLKERALSLIKNFTLKFGVNDMETFSYNINSIIEAENMVYSKNPLWDIK